MSYYIILAALVTSAILMFMVSVFSKRPLRGFGLFFMIVFLATWAGQLWISPLGPVFWGISWVPLIMVALFFLFLILALIPPYPKPNKLSTVKAEETAEGPFIVLSLFLWLVLLLLVGAIIVAYINVMYNV